MERYSYDDPPTGSIFDKIRQLEDKKIAEQRQSEAITQLMEEGRIGGGSYFDDNTTTEDDNTAINVTTDVFPITQHIDTTITIQPVEEYFKNKIQNDNKAKFIFTTIVLLIVIFVIYLISQIHKRKAYLKLKASTPQNEDKSDIIKLPKIIYNKFAIIIILLILFFSELAYNVYILSYLSNKKIIESKYPNNTNGLIKAINDDNIDIVKVFMQLDENNTNEKDNTGKTPLMYAALKGNQTIITILLSNNADVNAKDDNGWPVWIYASNKKTLEILKENGAKITNFDVNKKDIYGRTAIMYAAAKGNYEVVKTLIKYGADINIRDKYWLPVLIYSANKKILKILTDNGASLSVINIYNNISQWNMDDISITNATPFLIASMISCPSILDSLLHNGVKINEWKNKYALHCAIIARNTPNANYIIDKQANLNLKFIEGFTPLILASIIGNNEIVNKLLNNGAKANIKDNNNKTALYYAVVKNNLSIIKTLLANGATPDITTLKEAIMKNYTKEVNLFIKHGAILNNKDQYGIPLWIYSNNKEMLDIFIKHNVKIPNINVNGIINKWEYRTHTYHQITPLIVAIITGSKETVEKLVENGANINKKDIDGKTPLMYAVEYNKIEIVKYLLKNDVDINALDKKGNSALDYAHNREIINMLKE